MTQEHPITPSDELIGEWIDTDEGGPSVISRIATRAAQWGADQELAACCRQLTDPEWYDEIKNLRGPFRAAELRAARRPKPPSLKEQVLSSLTRLVVDLDRANMRDQATILEGPIRRALEQLDD
jgi:hypothetical protein